MKRALIVAATGGFLNGFLIPDMKLLQEMGYEVHCAANGNSVSTFVPEERFASIGVTFHQIDFSSTSPISKESLTAYKQYKELLNRYHFDLFMSILLFQEQLSEWPRGAREKRMRSGLYYTWFDISKGIFS